MYTAQYVLRGCGPVWLSAPTLTSSGRIIPFRRKQLWFGKCCHPPSSCWAFRPLAGELSLQGHPGNILLSSSQQQALSLETSSPGPKDTGWSPIRTPASGDSALSPAGMTLVTSLSVACFTFWIWPSCPAASVRNPDILPINRCLPLLSSRCPSAVATRTATVVWPTPTFLSGVCSFLVQEAELHPPLFPFFSSPTPQASYH